MDPQNATHLDPKLKETYERVMGTSLSQNTQQSPQAPQPAPQIVIPAQPMEPAPAQQGLPPQQSVVAAAPLTDASAQQPAHDSMQTGFLAFRPGPVDHTAQKQAADSSVMFPVAGNGQQSPAIPVPHQTQPEQLVHLPATPLQPSASNPQPATTLPTITFPTHVTDAPAASTATSTIATEDEDEKQHSIMPVVFMGAGIVFFVLWIVFWVRFFNLPLPF